MTRCCLMAQRTSRWWMTAPPIVFGWSSDDASAARHTAEHCQKTLRGAARLPWGPVYGARCDYGPRYTPARGRTLRRRISRCPNQGCDWLTQSPSVVSPPQTSQCDEGGGSTRVRIRFPFARYASERESGELERPQLKGFLKAERLALTFRLILSCPLRRACPVTFPELHPFEQGAACDSCWQGTCTECIFVVRSRSSIPYQHSCSVY